MPPSRQTLLVRVGCAEQGGLRHLPGDHLGVFPANREELVRGVLERVEDPPPPEQPLGMESRDGDPAGTEGERGELGGPRRYGGARGGRGDSTGTGGGQERVPRLRTGERWGGAETWEEKEEGAGEGKGLGGKKREKRNGLGKGTGQN